MHGTWEHPRWGLKADWKGNLYKLITGSLHSWVEMLMAWWVWGGFGWGWLRLAEFMHCIVLQHTCPAGDMQLVKFIPHTWSACRSMQFRNLLKSHSIIDYILCHIPYDEMMCSRAEQSWAVEMATRFIRIFCRSHDLSDIHLDTLETRHSVIVFFPVSVSVSISGSHRNSTGPN